MVWHNLPPISDRVNISENLGKVAALSSLPLIMPLNYKFFSFNFASTGPNVHVLYCNNRDSSPQALYTMANT